MTRHGIAPQIVFEILLRFGLEGGEPVLYRPDGERFTPYVQRRQHMEQAEQCAQRLAQRSRELWIDPDTI